jgi:branched-chain amino acid transport system permease protein
MLLLQLVINGLESGLLYALTAVGFALIFGATRIFHFAHGATYALAGYGFVLGERLGLGPVISVGLAFGAAVGFGLFIGEAVYRPIERSRGAFFTLFVAAFGMVIVVQSLLELTFGRAYVVVSSPLSRAEPWGGLYIAPLFWISLATAALLFGGLALFLKASPYGVALRALADSRFLVRVYGLSELRLSRLAFALGSALTVPGAVLGALSSGLTPSVGAHIMLVSLTAAVVGGIGSMPGAALAGILLGLVESLVGAVLDTEWSEASGFVLLFLFILLRPQGLFGAEVKR